MTFTWATVLGRSGYLVVHGDEGVMRGEGPGGALAVHQQGLLLAVHHVLLHLGDVVGHVVDHVHVQVVWRGGEDLGEGLRDRRTQRASPGLKT